MGIASNQQAPVNVSASDIVGRGIDPNIASPQATSALVNAFRDGFITADDVHARVGERAMLKEKADIANLKMELSPEIQQAKQTVALAAAERAKLDLEKAKEETELAPLKKQLARLDTMQAIANAASYGGAKETAALLNTAQVSVPTTPDGVIDMERARPLASLVGKYIAERKAKLEKLTELESTKPTSMTVQDARRKITGNVNVDRFGNRFDQNSLLQLRKQANTTFTEWLAGRAQPGEVALDDATRAGRAQELQAAGLSTAGMSPEAIEAASEQMRRAQFFPETIGEDAVVPRTAAPAAPAAPAPVIEPAGSAPSLGIDVVTGVEDIPLKPVPGEGVEKLDLARGAVDIAGRLQTAYNNLVQSEPELVGFLQGQIPRYLGGRRWNEKVANFEAEATAILAPLAKGTYNETGVLSDKDVERYRSIIPDLRDNPKIGAQKAQQLFSSVTEAWDRKLDSWKRAGFDVSGFEGVTFGKPGAPAGKSAPQGVTKTLSNGRVITQTPDGKFYEPATAKP